jgi:hypothetical protein
MNQPCSFKNLDEESYNYSKEKFDVGLLDSFYFKSISNLTF